MKKFLICCGAAMVFVVGVDRFVRAADAPPPPPPGNDLHYVFSHLDDPDPAKQATAFEICRMTSANGAQQLEAELAAPAAKISPASRQQLQAILDQQKSVRQKWAADAPAHQVWLKSTTVDAYEKFGSHDDSWDAPSREALRLYIKQDRTLEEDRKLTADLQQVNTTRCDDALVKSIVLERDAIINGREGAAEADLQNQVNQMMRKSHYPASRKILSFANFYSAVSMQGEQQQQGAVRNQDRSTKRLLSEMLKILPEALADPGAPREALINATRTCMEGCVATGMDRNMVYDQFDEVLKPMTTPAELLAYQGEFLINYAWDARGGGWASSVTPQGAKDFSDRITQAGEALTQSWQTDPTAFDGRAATEMIVVCMATSAADDERELWFRRAMEVNPDNKLACEKEMDAIDPRWTGARNTNALSRLSRVFELSGNDTAGISLLVGPIQMAMGYSTVNSDGMHLNHEWFERPEVFETIRRVFEPYLKKHPGDRTARNAYICYCEASAHYDALKEQLLLFQGVPNVDEYRSNYEDFRKVWKLCLDQMGN